MDDSAALAFWYYVGMIIMAIGLWATPHEYIGPTLVLAGGMFLVSRGR